MPHIGAPNAASMDSLLPFHPSERQIDDEADQHGVSHVCYAGSPQNEHHRCHYILDRGKSQREELRGAGCDVVFLGTVSDQRDDSGRRNAGYQQISELLQRSIDPCAEVMETHTDQERHDKSHEQIDE